MSRWVAVMMAIVVLATASSVRAETEPEAFLGNLPAVPGDGCPVDQESGDAFKMQLYDFIKRLQEQIDFRKDRIEAWQQQNDKGIVTAAADTPGIAGIDPDEIDKMSDEERMRLAEKIMQEKHGISMAEINKLAAMDETGAMGWGQAVVAEQQAEAEIDPDKAAADQQENRNLLAIQQEMMPLVQKQAAMSQKYAAQYAELEADRQGLKLKTKVEDLEAELAELSRNSAPCAAIEAKEKALYEARNTYCRYMAPRYLDILRRNLAALKETKPDCDKIDALQIRQMQAQFGVTPPPEQSGLSMLEAILTYTMALEQAYRYDGTYGPFESTCREGL